jgi:hypothetical protein
LEGSLSIANIRAFPIAEDPEPIFMFVVTNIFIKWIRMLACMAVAGIRMTTRFCCYGYRVEGGVYYHLKSCDIPAVPKAIIILRKVHVFFEECRLLGCGAVSILCEPTFRRNVFTQDGILHSHRCENLKSYVYVFCYCMCPPTFRGAWLPRKDSYKKTQHCNASSFIYSLKFFI